MVLCVTENGVGHTELLENDVMFFARTLVLQLVVGLVVKCLVVTRSSDADEQGVDVAYTWREVLEQEQCDRVGDA